MTATEFSGSLAARIGLDWSDGYHDVSLQAPRSAGDRPHARGPHGVAAGAPPPLRRPPLIGASTLVRNDKGVRMTFRTTGLEPGSVATIWWVVFNNPAACAVPGSCTGPDSGNPAADVSSFYAAGHVIGGSGKANYAASLPVGRLAVDPDPDANQLVPTPFQAQPGDGILKDARDAEIHLVLRTHGPAIPGQIDHQLSTFDGGCTTAPPALQGPNTCMNLQVAIHRP